MCPCSVLPPTLYSQQQRKMDTLFPVDGQLDLSEKIRPLTQTSTLQIFVQLAEKRLFVQGFDANEYKSRPPTLLRGALVVRVLKTSRIKNITLSLKGTARTEWPEGIPPKRQENMEENDIINHTWPFFSNGKTSGADFVQPLGGTSDSEADVLSLNLDNTSIRSGRGNGPASSALSALKRVASPSPSRGRSSSTKLFGVASHNEAHSDPNEIFTFSPGDYIYKFEHPIPCSTPETIHATFGSVLYALNILIERYGAFKSNISSSLPLTIIRAPSDESVEDSEPIAISRDWEDQLHYDIIIASKSIILNAYIPIAFKLIPLAKIKLHRIRIYLTENIEYYCKNKKVHRMEPTKKYMLLEHKAPVPPGLAPDSDPKLKKMGNLLTSDGFDLTAKEFEFQVYVPEKLNNQATLHPNTSYSNIKSHHWIKICLRLSRIIDGKPKHYEISIDSPIHILSQHCSHANTLLPAYGIPDLSENAMGSNIYFPKDIINSPELSPLNSPEVTPVDNTPYHSLSSVLSQDRLPQRSRSSSSLNHSLPNFESTISANVYKPQSLDHQLTSPQALPVSPISSPIQRPIHLLRRPSFDPPAFDEDVSPPPLSRLNPPGGIDAVFENERSFTPLNSPPPVTRRNGVRDEDIPNDPPTYDDFLQEDGKTSPFHERAGRNSVPDIVLTNSNGDNVADGTDQDLGDNFKFKGGSPNMPASVVRSTSPLGQRHRELARTPRASPRGSLEIPRHSDETIDHVLESTHHSLATSIEADDPIHYSPELRTHNTHEPADGRSRFSSRSSLSPTDLITPDENPTLFEPLLHSNSTSLSLEPRNDLNSGTPLQGPYGQYAAFRERLESHDSIKIRREPSSVDITSLYSHNNPFIVPNTTNMIYSNVVSQRQHSISSGMQQQERPVTSPGSGSRVGSFSGGIPKRPNSGTRQNSIQSLNPIMSVLDEESPISSPSLFQTPLVRPNTTSSVISRAISEEDSNDGKKSETSSILDHISGSNSTSSSGNNSGTCAPDRVSVQPEILLGTDTLGDGHLLKRSSVGSVEVEGEGKAIT